MNKTIQVLVFKAQEGLKENCSNASNIEVKAIENTLSAFYDEIGCQFIEIVKTKIRGKYYNVVCDEEGLNKENPIPTVLTARNPYEKIVGTVIITGVEDEHGDLTSLTDEDIDNISNRMKLVRLKAGENETISKVIIID
jgi:hypothetical protein